MVFEVLRGSRPLLVSPNELFMFLCILNRRATAAERLLRSLLMDLRLFAGRFTAACEFNYRHLLGE